MRRTQTPIDRLSAMGGAVLVINCGSKPLRDLISPRGDTLSQFHVTLELQFTTRDFSGIRK